MYKLYNLKTLVYISIILSAPIIVVALILIFFLTTGIKQYLLAKLPSISDNVFLTPKSRNQKPMNKKIYASA